jgi:hypothetical protein
MPSPRCAKTSRGFITTCLADSSVFQHLSGTMSGSNPRFECTPESLHYNVFGGIGLQRGSHSQIVQERKAAKQNSRPSAREGAIKSCLTVVLQRHAVVISPSSAVKGSLSQGMTTGVSSFTSEPIGEPTWWGCCFTIASVAQQHLLRNGNALNLSLLHLKCQFS